MEVLKELSLIIFLSISGLFLLLLIAFTEVKNRFLSYLTIFLSVVSFLFSLKFSPTIKNEGFTLMKSDTLSLFFSSIFVLSSLFIVLILPEYLERKEASRVKEVYPLIIFSVVGMIILANSINFLMFFVGLELMSISFYVLCGLLKEQEYSIESSLKYFILGVLSTSFILLGIAMIYGSTSSLNYYRVNEAIQSEVFNFGEPLMVFGFVLFLFGLLFKLSLVPFHFWAPDVYQGAPTPITALLSVGGKSAAVAATIRFYTVALSNSILFEKKWFLIFSIIGLITIFVGSLIALTQTELKRLFSYSSIVHAGFLALGIASLSKSETINRAIAAISFYVAAYLFMNIAVFTFISSIERKSKMDESIEILNQFGSKISPFVSYLFSINILSLMGIPLTAGFLGKFYVFSHLILQNSKEFYVVSIIGLLGAIIATFYYLKILLILYFKKGENLVINDYKMPFNHFLVLILTTFFTLLFGIFPSFVLEFL